MSHFDLVRTHRSTAVEQARRRSLYPGLGERALAFGIDVGAFVVTAPFLLGFCAVLLQDYWVVGAVAVVVGYVAGSWALCGKTIGMAFAGIELLDERTGRCPAIPQVAMRTALTVPPLVGGAVVLNELLAPGAAPLAEGWLLLAAAAALVGVLSSAWALLDSGRMLHDRLSGLVTVRTEVADQLGRARR
ncbi:MAG: RDD family protein [Dehalococcoidia bacterium]